MSSPPPSKPQSAQQRWYAETIPLRDQVIADVGANRGELSQFFWDQGGGTSAVVSVEPLAENVALIEERVRRARAARWRVEPVAATARDGELVLHAARTPETGWNSVVRRDGREDATTRRVPGRRLSQLVPDATVVKLDVEGHEYEILDEALTALGGVHSWALELHSVPGRPLQDVLGRLVGAGFAVVAAGRKAGSPDGDWLSVPVDAALTWEQIPVARRLADGSPFRMLHVIARRG